MHSISNRNFEIHIFALLTSRRKFQNVTVEEAAAVEVQEEAPAEGGLVDIASILGAPAVTIVWSSL
jgi:hypothetical protein